MHFNYTNEIDLLRSEDAILHHGLCITIATHTTLVDLFEWACGLSDPIRERIVTNRSEKIESFLRFRAVLITSWTWGVIARL